MEAFFIGNGRQREGQLPVTPLADEQNLAFRKDNPIFLKGHGRVYRKGRMKWLKGLPGKADQVMDKIIRHRRNRLITAATLFVGAFGNSDVIAAPVYEGPVSDHFDGRVFYNCIPDEKGFLDLLKFGTRFATEKAPWPKWIETVPQKVPQKRQRGDAVSVTYINHSTVLIQVDGVNILTDPIFSRRASFFTWWGPERVRAPGVRFEDLPPIDVILVSHNHYDHLDIETLRRLQFRYPDRRPPLVLSGLGNGLLFEENGITRCRDLDWGESAIQGGIEFVFAESRHRSGRGLADQMGTLWGAFVIKTRMGNIYFAGDTAYGPHFAQAAGAYGPFILSFLPIGAYEPRWFMKSVHLNPKDAVHAHLDLKSSCSMAIHHGTFQLTYEAIDQPTVDLKTALVEMQVAETDFIVPGFGETRVLNLTAEKQEDTHERRETVFPL